MHRGSTELQRRRCNNPLFFTRVLPENYIKIVLKASGVTYSRPVGLGLSLNRAKRRTQLEHTKYPPLSVSSVASVPHRGECFSSAGTGQKRRCRQTSGGGFHVSVSPPAPLSHSVVMVGFTLVLLGAKHEGGPTVKSKERNREEKERRGG